MRKRVSEKTLEPNIAAELLQVIRALPGCERAFWIGLKQDQEARWGMDELIRNVPRGYHLALQFKAPKALPADALPYSFTINDRQNGNLLKLARAGRDAVFYVFPHYNSLSRLGSSVPSLLADTWFLRVFDLNGLQPSSNLQGTHAVKSRGTVVDVYSDPYSVQAVRVDALEMILKDNRMDLGHSLLPHTFLQKWIEEACHQPSEDRRIIGQLFRGFSTICIPTNP